MQARRAALARKGLRAWQRAGAKPAFSPDAEPGELRCWTACCVSAEPSPTPKLVPLHREKRQHPPAPCGIGMSGHPGRTGHLDIRPAERVVGPYGLFLPLRAITPSSLLQRHLPGSFRGSSPVPESSTAPPEPFPANRQTCHTHRPEEQGDQDRVPAALGSAARTEATKGGDISRVPLPGPRAAAASARAANAPQPQLDAPLAG